MTTFIETPRFPSDISFGAQGGPSYNTDVTIVRSGHESRLARWVDSRCKYDVSYGVRTQAELDTLIAFFRIVSGKAIGFRFKDWADYQVTVTQGILGAGVGTGAATYQLNKKYVSGALTDIRAITKPVTISGIYKNGLLQTLTTHYTADSATGLITFLPIGSPSFPQAYDVLTWFGEYDVPVRFDTDELRYQILDKSPSGALHLSWQGVPLVEIRV